MYNSVCKHEFSTNPQTLTKKVRKKNTHTHKSKVKMWRS